MEHRLTQLETKMSDIDARASEEADCNANDRDLDRFIYSGEFLTIYLNAVFPYLVLLNWILIKLTSCI